MSASIQFIDCKLSLIHIPLPLYSHFVHAIFQLILPDASMYRDEAGGEPSIQDSSSSDGSVPAEFINISVTPVECSVVCSKDAATKYFRPIAQALAPEQRATVAISDDVFVAIQVDGEGLEAGQRVLDLTSPLALAGISIFFITTYFSDYIVVPSKSRKAVVKALQERGFVFEEYTDSYVTSKSAHRLSSASSASNGSTPTTSPSTTSLTDLSERTFHALHTHNVNPAFDPGLQLLLCAGHRTPQYYSCTELKFALLQSLVSRPRFISVTLTDTEPVSLLLEKDILPLFPEDTLLGRREDVLIPIVFDLKSLPEDATGIVCGVAGRLVGSARKFKKPGEGFEMSYLSTAKAGTVMVTETDLERAMEALKF